MLSRILVPLDGSPAMASILPTVRHLVGGTGAVVHLLALRPSARELAREEDCLRDVYVDDVLLEGLVGWIRPAAGPRRSLETRLREERATWQAYLLRQASQLAYDGMVVQREVSFGDPLVGTLAAAQRQATHLIALSAPPQSWLGRHVRPSLAQQLLQHSTVPVLAVPPAPPARWGSALRYRSLPA